MSFQTAAYSFDETSVVKEKKKKEKKKGKKEWNIQHRLRVGKYIRRACIISRNKWKGGEIR